MGPNLKAKYMSVEQQFLEDVLRVYKAPKDDRKGVYYVAATAFECDQCRTKKDKPAIHSLGVACSFSRAEVAELAAARLPDQRVVIVIVSEETSYQDIVEGWEGWLTVQFNIGAKRAHRLAHTAVDTIGDQLREVARRVKREAKLERLMKLKEDTDVQAAFAADGPEGPDIKADLAHIVESLTDPRARGAVKRIQHMVNERTIVLAEDYNDEGSASDYTKKFVVEALRHMGLHVVDLRLDQEQKGAEGQ